MRTAQLLPVSPSMHCLGVPGQGCTWSGGVPGPRRVPGPGGCTWSQLGVPAQVLPPPVNRITDRCKNITLPQTLFAGGNYRFTTLLSLSKVRLHATHYNSSLPPSSIFVALTWFLGNFWKKLFGDLFGGAHVKSKRAWNELYFNFKFPFISHENMSLHIFHIVLYYWIIKICFLSLNELHMNVYMPFTHAPLKRKLKKVSEKLCQSDRKSNLDKMSSCSD